VQQLRKLKLQGKILATFSPNGIEKPERRVRQLKLKK